MCRGIFGSLCSTLQQFVEAVDLYEFVRMYESLLEMRKLIQYYVFSSEQRN